jgi:NTP pyrophosphatase (non-canonical NTP hydrolase)
MKQIIEENYKSIVDRGLISFSTTKEDFLDKLYEEVNEFESDFLDKDCDISEELSDVILVCLNIAKHYDIDIEKSLKNKIQINKNR